MKLKNETTGDEVETSSAVEATNLRARGYTIVGQAKNKARTTSSSKSGDADKS